jgi:hypothetical protein
LQPSPDVRFWCVFALGKVTELRPKKLTRAGIRALEERLEAWAVPQAGGYWPIRFEALAMLQGRSASASDLFHRELQRVLNDPLGNPELWPWAQFYAEDASEALGTIAAAGVDPVTLGRPHLANQNKR